MTIIFALPDDEEIIAGKQRNVNLLKAKKSPV
jgi:hypothetical protein